MKSSSINTQKGPVDWDTAQHWIANEPGAIDARFFGRNTFKRLFRDLTCTAVKATFATDEQQKPQLLLCNASLKVAIDFEDASRPCPPYCHSVAHHRWLGVLFRLGEPPGSNNNTAGGNRSDRQTQRH